MKKKPKIVEIDIIRALAILAVVVIHGTSSAALLPIGTFSQAAFYILNRLSHFTVPVFIWISGLVLFYSYYDTWDKKTAFPFLLKRLRLILVPYGVWSVFYYLYNQVMYHSSISFDAFYLFKLFLSGNASYHLYYMVIILQFYVVFPLLLTLCTQSSRFRLFLIPIGVGVQAVFYSFSHWVWPIPYYESLFPAYFALFAFGAYTGMYYHKVVSWLKQRARWVYAACLLSGALITGMYVGNQYGKVHFENTWYELTLLIYCMTAALSLIQIGKTLIERKPQTAAVLLRLGSASFGIYLVHPALLTLWDRVVEPPVDIWLFDLHTIAAIMISLLGSWGLILSYRWIGKKRTVSQPSKNLSA